MIERAVFDPRPAPLTGSTRRSQRLETLDGVVLAVVDNGKTHAGALLELLVAHLRRQWTIAGIVHLGPPSPGHGGLLADAEVAAEWATAAVCAIGDCGSCSAGTVMDAIILERLGVPAVPIVTRPFIPTAQTLTARHALDSTSIAVVDHPITSLDRTQLDERAAAAAPQVVQALLGREPDRRVQQSAVTVRS